jgi:hypothetical protein
MVNSHDMYVKQRDLTLGSAFWGSQRNQKLPKRSFPQNTPKFGPVIGISSLNKIINNFSTVHAIFAQISSIGAAWRVKLKNFLRNHLTFVLGVTFFGKYPQCGFQAKAQC